MSKRKVEVFSAGCPLCQSAIDLVNRLVCTSCEVTVLDMNDIRVAERARALGVRTAPAVAVDGRLLSCCVSAGNRAQAQSLASHVASARRLDQELRRGAQSD